LKRKEKKRKESKEMNLRKVDISGLPQNVDPRRLGGIGFCEVCNKCTIMVDLRQLCKECSDVPQWKEPKPICKLHGYVNCTASDCYMDVEAYRGLCVGHGMK